MARVLSIHALSTEKEGGATPDVGWFFMVKTPPRVRLSSVPLSVLEFRSKRSGNRVLAFALPKSATGGIEGAEYQQTDDADCGHGFGYKNAMTWVGPRAECPVRNDDQNRH
jgi:hypothetical protein